MYESQFAMPSIDTATEAGVDTVPVPSAEEGGYFLRTSRVDALVARMVFFPFQPSVVECDQLPRRWKLNLLRPKLQTKSAHDLLLKFMRLSFPNRAQDAQKYTDILWDEGLECASQLSIMTESELQDLEIPLHDCRRMLRSVLSERHAEYFVGELADDTKSSGWLW